MLSTVFNTNAHTARAADARPQVSLLLALVSSQHYNFDSETLGSEGLISLWNSGHQGNGFSSLALLSLLSAALGLIASASSSCSGSLSGLLLGMSVGTVRRTQDACLYQQQNLVLGTVVVP